MADLDRLLTDAEADIARTVTTALDQLADDIADELDDATEIVAARFRLGRIATMWRENIPRIMRRLFRVAETAGEQVAEDVDADLPATWRDLPGRYDSGFLPASLGAYAEATEHLLRAVGDHLTERAITVLAQGLDAGDDVPALRARLAVVFAEDGPQLGESRAELIAITEATRAWNAATLAAAQELTGPARPLVKQWRTRGDNRVRRTHGQVDGFVRLLDDAFTVGGVPMQYPGDPTAPAEEVCNCRCVLRIDRAEQTAAAGADGSHLRGGMIALIPTAEDAERLALEGGEDAGELHCTLYFLGDEGADWDEDQRGELITAIQSRAAGLDGPVRARAFGVNCWNPDGDHPAWVWAVGDDTDSNGPRLEDARWVAVDALEDGPDRPETPRQHSPWVAHVTAAYDTGTWPHDPMCERIGPVTFDRIRVAFGGDHTDIPLGPPEETTMPESTAAADWLPAPRTWSTPDGTALAYENQETGDGRIFAAGSLYWDEGAPSPLQYADEMGMGHDGAELVGSINTMTRDGDRITGTGDLYELNTAGWEAVALLEMGAPLGVSVDLDDVTIEFIDTTGRDADEPEAVEPEPEAVASATYARMSVLRLADGGWAITASGRPETTATAAAITRSLSTVQVITGPDGRLPAPAARTLTAAAITAAAGDPDNPDAVVIHTETAADLLVRIAKGRVRGATLVAMPAYHKARIVLDPLPDTEPVEPELVETAASAVDTAAAVLDHARTISGPFTARTVTAALGLPLPEVKKQLRAAARGGQLKWFGRSHYMALTAAASGNLDLPIHEDRDAEWDGDAAAARVLAWATDDNGDVDPNKLEQAFLWRDPDGDPATLAAYKLGMADVVDGELHIFARAVFAIAAALSGARGGVDIPADEQDALKSRVDDLYARLAAAFGDDSLAPPWSGENPSEAGTTMCACRSGSNNPPASTAGRSTPSEQLRSSDAKDAQSGISSNSSARGPVPLAFGNGKVSRASVDAAKSDPSPAPDPAYATTAETTAHSAASASKAAPTRTASPAASGITPSGSNSQAAANATVNVPSKPPATTTLPPESASPSTGATSSSARGTASPQSSFSNSSTAKAEGARSAQPNSLSASALATPASPTSITATAPAESEASSAPPATTVSASSKTTLNGWSAQPPTYGRPPTDYASADDDLTELEASAWDVMRAAPPMPAAWFREPTAEELPPGSGGVHYADGRVYGWVAQAGVPHATHGRKVTIEKLAAGRGLDLTHFLRARFTLDDGSEVKAGAFTMDVGHHRDGYECETAACQFDSTRTVAGIVTVGMNEGGLWFSGAAAPHLSDWDKSVFLACQPSYHMVQGGDGRWQLRAVLSVPVPGHSSPLLATAFVERSNLALTAAAAMVAEQQRTAVEPEPEHAAAEATIAIDSPAVVSGLAAAILTPTFLDTLSAALDARARENTAARAEADALAALITPARTAVPINGRN